MNFEVAAVPVADGNRDLLMGLRERVRTDRLLTTVLEGIPDLALMVTPDRQIIAANTRVTSALGLAPDALVGKRPGEGLSCVFSVDGDDGCGSGAHCSHCGMARSVLESFREGRQMTFECRFREMGDDGAILDLEVTSTPMFLDGIQVALCVLKDVSSEKRKRILEKTFFHDVMNTAAGIRGIASFLAAGKIPPERESQYRESLLILAERLVDELCYQRKLLAAERGELLPEHDMIPLSVFLQELAAIYSKHDLADGAEIVVRVLSDAIFVSDRTLLARVLGNLILNALEAPPRVKKVTLEAAAEGSDIRISVMNPGVMAEECRLNLFQRSFSTKGGGRGLGTYSAKLFVEKYLKGNIRFRSTEEEGTVFTVSLSKTPRMA